MNTLSQQLKQKIKSYFKEAFNRDLSDDEVLEVAESLYSFAKAKINFLHKKEMGHE